MGFQTSQPQNTENLETEVTKSGDFFKNLKIDRPADKTKQTQVLIKRKCNFRHLENVSDQNARDW